MAIVADYQARDRGSHRCGEEHGDAGSLAPDRRRSERARSRLHGRHGEVARRELARFSGHDAGPVTLERLAVELEAALDRDTIYVNDIDSGKKMDAHMSFGGNDKMYVANGPNILGLGHVGRRRRQTRAAR
jgi:hypothetical protein